MQQYVLRARDYVKTGSIESNLREWILIIIYKCAVRILLLSAINTSLRSNNLMHTLLC